MREVKIYSPSINESGYQEFLEDIKSFTHIGKFDHKATPWKNTSKTGHGLKNKMRFFIKILRKLFPQIQDLEKDIEKAKNNNLRTKLAKEGKNFLLCLYPVGKVLDARYPDGTEVV